MDCVIIKSKNEVGVKKRVFERKHIRKDGLLLQVHHTIDGEAKPVRFLHVAFQEGTDTLAVSDVKGNLFIIDLTYNRFWALPNLENCSGLAFPPYDKSLLFISSSNCSIKIVNFENGEEINCLRGHKLPPNQLTFGGKGGKWLLSAASSLFKSQSSKELPFPNLEQTGEVLVWDLDSYCLAHRLNVRPDSGICKALFMDGASSGRILVCFKDDAMFVWQLGKFESMKQILPVKLSDAQHNVKAIAVTRNGRALVVGGKSHSLVVISLDSWNTEKIIELPAGICGIKYLQFLPQPFDGGSNSVLTILTSTSQVYVLDLQTSTFIGNILVAGRKNIRKLICSHSGRYIACVLDSGEVNIYSSTKVIENGFNREGGVPVAKGIKIEKVVDKEPNPKVKDEPLTTTGKFSKQRIRTRFCKVGEEVKSELDPCRLLPMLRQVGEFPVRYRLLAWRKALLQLPCNRKAYASLVERGIHPSFSHLEEKYPLEKSSELKNLKRLLSCLAHWSPLFSQVMYLPLFSYPFVKLFSHDPFSCFEAVVTIIMNYCQHWFEFFPFPPINVLAAVENMIAHHDSELFQHFVRNGVDTRIYAWPMLKVAFSEVLSNGEWLRLWDHILANEPAFLLAAVPAYCIVCRSALLSCKNIEDFQYFFQNQNPINMDKFILKIYKINKSTPDKLHPRKYLREFKCLPEGDTYPVFNQYPKILVDGHAEKLQKLQVEEEDIIKKELAALKIIHEKEEQKISAENELIRQQHLAEVENAYQMALKIEEEKLEKRRLEVMTLKKELAKLEVAARNRSTKRDGDDETNLQLSTIKQLLKELEQKVYDSNNKPASSRENRKASFAGMLSPLSCEVFDSDHHKRREFRETSSTREDEKAFSEVHSTNNPRMESSCAKRHVHKNIKGISRGKETVMAGFPVTTEYKGWFEKESIMRCLRSKCENLRMNETDSLMEYSHRHRDDQIKEMCFMCSPQGKDQREKDFTTKPSYKKTRENKQQKFNEKTDEINFIRGEEKQRWQLDQRYTDEQAFYKGLQHNELSTLRNDEFYSEEQQAIQHAMELRASLVFAKSKILQESTSSSV